MMGLVFAVETRLRAILYTEVRRVGVALGAVVKLAPATPSDL
jgi:hypothetical protein